MENTCRDFWKMVYERDCSSIVMLSGIIENEQVRGSKMSLSNAYSINIGGGGIILKQILGHASGFYPFCVPVQKSRELKCFRSRHKLKYVFSLHPCRRCVIGIGPSMVCSSMGSSPSVSWRRACTRDISRGYSVSQTQRY